MTTIEFMEKHLEDAVDDNYRRMCEKVIQNLEDYSELSRIVFAQYSSIDDFESALRKFAER